MQYPEVIRITLDYIEQNLKTDIAAEELAQMVNYSTYHYCRLFSSITGSSVSGYILKRRLDKALAEIANGRKAIDVVLEIIQWGMGIDESFFDDNIENFGKLYDRLPKQLIHRDPNPCNILFENGEVSGFIDFDLSEINVRLWDVCYCATGILCEASDGVYEKWLDILAGILHGYDHEGKLMQEEKQAVFYVICSILMICIAYFESQDKFKGIANTNRKMLQFVVRNRKCIDNIF